MDNLAAVGHWIKKGTKHIGVFLVAYTALCGVAMMLEISADVFGRYLFRHPLPGTIHMVSYYYMVAFIYLPLAFVQNRKEHIVALFFTAKLPDSWKTFLDLIAQLLMFGIFFIFGWYTWKKALMAMSYGEFVEETIRIVVWPTHFYLPIGAFALCLQLLVDMVDNAMILARGRGEE